MKILLVCDLYDERVQYRENLLAKYYAKHGHEVVILASTATNAFDFNAGRHDRAAPGGETRVGPVKVIRRRYSLNLLNRLRRLEGFAEILDREQPDLVMMHDVHMNLPEAVAYRRRHPGSRLVMGSSVDRTNSAKNAASMLLLHRVLRRYLVQRSLPFLDRIYPVTPVVERFLREIYGVPAGKMELLPLGLDTDLARSVGGTGAREAVRASLGIPSDAIVVFTGGKLRPLKQTHLVLEALALTPPPRCHVIVVGDTDEDDASYREHIAGLSASQPTVHRVGWVHGDDVYRYLAASDLAVFPASQSVLWQQSLGLGLPIVVGRATVIGDQDPSYLNPFDNMIILEPEQITAGEIAARIQSFVSDPQYLAGMKARALRAADKLLNYDHIVNQTLRVFSEGPRGA